MPGKYNRTFADYTSEKSTVSIYIPTLTSANYDAVSAQIDDLDTAMNAVVLGSEVKRQIVSAESGSGQGQASNAYAQREMKWLCTYQDDVTLKYHNFEMPCPKLDANLVDNNGDADLSQAAWSAFVTAFEAVARSADGNAVTFVRARLVGRNN